MFHPQKPLRWIALSVWWCGVTTGAWAIDPEVDFYAAPIDGGMAQWVALANERVGWQPLAEAGFLGSSTVVANVEAGHIWFGHEVFIRPETVTNGFTNFVNVNALNELDYHATMVGHVLAGSGYNGSGYSYLGVGMAPEASVLSGSVAVQFSTNNVGSFATTYDSVMTPYRAFFTGEGSVRADVINSSWGGNDPAAVSPQMVALDGLAAQNTDVALVVSAGNSGNQPVGSPADGFNNIAVGSLGGKNFLVPSAFSSRGMNDFYNPVTDEMVEDARVAVQIAAPGEAFFLAAYLGNSGGLGAALPGITVEPPPSDQYFYNMDGTSFASPMVAGGLAQLKDAARRDAVWNLNEVEHAFDTRVAATVLMAGALETYGWDNGQRMTSEGYLATSQALDASTGAGALQLMRSAEAYLLGSRGDGGSVIEGSGWDFAQIGVGSSKDYMFAGSMVQDVELTVGLNWFAGRDYDMATGVGSNLSFADLNLEVWEVLDESFSSLVGQSATIYNNTEFLRLDLSAGKTYGLRVTFDGMVYDQTPGVLSESYGLAWLTSAYGTAYWNPAGTNRVWDGLVQNWSSAPPGNAGVTSAVTTGLDQLVWEAGTNATVAVTVEGAQLARSMIFNSATILTASNAASVYLQSGGLTASETAAGDARIGGAVSLLLSGSQSWRNNSAFDLIVEGGVSGSGDVTLQANSTGAVLIGGTFNAAGLLINAGTGDGEVRVSGSIGSDVAGITQSSPTSRLVIEGAASHTYAGLTRVTAGELVVNGNISNSGGLTVLSEGVLSGSGTLASALIAGTHSPGNSPGIQTFTQNLSYETAAEVVWELVASTTSSRGVNYDGVDVGGNLAFAGATSLRLIFDLPESGVLWSDSFWNANRPGSSGWLVFKVTGQTSGFANLNVLPEDWVDAAGQSFSISRSHASFGLAQVGSDVYLTYTAVPEPRVYILLVLGGALLALRGGLRAFSVVGRGCRGSGRRGS